MEHRPSHCRVQRRFRLWRLTLAVVAALVLLAPLAGAQAPGEDVAAAWSVDTARTDSPQETLASFLRLRSQLEAVLHAYWTRHDRSSAERALLIADEFVSLLDVTGVPAAARRSVGFETTGYLLDIFGRIPLPPLGGVPDVARIGAEGPAAYVIPETPFRIVRMDAGPRAGEFLFSAQTIQLAPRVHRALADHPLRTSLPIGTWTTALGELTGPLIPARLIAAVPDPLRATFLGTPLWKSLLLAGAALLALAAVILWHRTIVSAGGGERLDRFWRQMTSALFAMAVIACLGALAFELNLLGPLSRAVDAIGTLLVYGVLAWIFWLLGAAGLDMILRRKDLSEATLDSNLLRLLARLVGLIGVIVILSFGAQALGLPVFSIFAGLGIGGLAIALAIRPTLENLIAGFVLYLDRPIRVGDFCTFGERSGTVESIGVRSIQIRALDRTLISVPNAQFADMHIVNWARCDQMLISHKIGLRYETDADQLRCVLAKIREMFHAHPRIDGETVRVRFVGFGPSALEVDIRVHARTHEWNDFYAIREDVLFRVKEIVEQAGTGFAFPSQTLYVGRDGGLDADLGRKAREEVALWRRTGRLPFPRLSPERITQLVGRLKYPPPGSPDFDSAADELAEAGGERLSAETPPKEVLQEDTAPPRPAAERA